MSRILFQLFLAPTPFIAYAVWLWATNRGWRAPERWRGVPLLWLIAAAIALTAASLAVLALTTGGSNKALYTPAHMENGRFVPGRIVEPDQK